MSNNEDNAFASYLQCSAFDVPCSMFIFIKNTEQGTLNVEQENNNTSFHLIVIFFFLCFLQALNAQPEVEITKAAGIWMNV